MRDKGRFTSGGMLPQTVEGWIDRFVVNSERKIINRVGIKPLREKKYRQQKMNDPIKHEKRKKQQRESHQRNIETDNLRSKNNYHKDPMKYRIKFQKYYETNRDKIVENQFDYYWNRGGREVQRIYNKNNPRSGGGSDDIDVILAMNNVRKRDNNTCQWAGCGLNHRNASIHVHHIFPRSEYPDLDTVEQYMICYCANHHALFHRARGDFYSEIISPTYQETALDKIMLREPWQEFN